MEPLIRDELFRQARLAALGSLSGQLVHDLCNPLTIMLGKSEELKDLIEDGADKADLLKALTKLSGGVQRMATLVSTMRNFAKADETELTEVDLLEVLGDIKTLRNILFKGSMAQTECEMPMEPIKIQGNAARVLEVLIYLVANAREALLPSEHRDGRVKVALYKEKEQAVIVVEDNGKGIAPSDLPKIFDPYFTTKTPTQKIGMGLALVQEIVKGYQGTVVIDSQVNEGTKVFLRFPLLA